MKKQTKIIIALLVIVLLSVSLLSVFNSSAVQAHIGDAQAKAAEKAALDENKVKNMSFGTVVKNLNRLREYQTDAADALVTALTEKIKITPTDVITKEIKSKKNTDAVRRSIIIQCESNGIAIDRDILAEMLSDKKESIGMKVFLIGELSAEGGKYSRLIKEFLQSDSDTLWGKAMLEQVKSAPDNAKLISDTVLEDFDGTITRRYKTALEIKALLAAQSKKSEDYNNLIELCKRTVSEADNKDEAISAATNALYYAPSIETLKYVFGDGSPFGTEYKHPIAFENKEIIRDLFTQKANTETAALLSNIIGFTGDEYKDDVRRYIDGNSEFFNEHKELLSVFSSFV